jgi:hypothetical protein
MAGLVPAIHVLVSEQDVDARHIILLRHKFRRYVAARTPQHGQRGKLLASASINRLRMVAIEFGM